MMIGEIQQYFYRALDHSPYYLGHFVSVAALLANSLNYHDLTYRHSHCYLL